MTATWGALFERSAAYDVSEDDVRRALAERRNARAAAGDGDAEGEDDVPGDDESDDHGSDR